MVRLCLLCKWKVIELFREKDWKEAIEMASELSFKTGDSYFTITESLPDEDVEGLSDEELINAFDERIYKPIREGRY